jgi:hypothetical protein
MKLRLAVLLLTSIALPVHLAAMDVKSYQKFPKDDISKKVLLMYVRGVGDALGWSNAYLTTTKQKPMYCVPPKLALETENYKRLLDDEIKMAKAKVTPDQVKSLGAVPLNDAPIEMLLLFALVDAFPCPAETQ